MNLFFILLSVGSLLIAAGLFVLIYAAPKWTPKGDLKTEMFSARAALWCVGVGLTIIIIGALEASIKEVMLRKP